jgi:hypothetical protein
MFQRKLKHSFMPKNVFSMSLTVLKSLKRDVMCIINYIFELSYSTMKHSTFSVKKKKQERKKKFLSTDRKVPFSGM